MPQCIDLGRYKNTEPLTSLKSISWPAQSPGLYIIENICLYIKRKLAYRHHVINSDDDLFSEIQRIWMDIPNPNIQSLYLSIPRRIMSVNRGYYTSGHSI